MQKHYGQIVEHLIRKNGYSITDLAKEMEVNRRTVYNWFQNKYLKADLIYRIGIIARHDFSKEFPELFTPNEFIKQPKSNTDFTTPITGTKVTDGVWKDKYLTLLEKYNELLVRRVEKSSLA